MTQLSRRPLRVVPNPYHHLDHNGFPAAAYPYDSQFSAGHRRYVGASIDTEKTVVRDTRGAQPQPTRGAFVGALLRGPDQTLRWRFKLQPVDIQDTVHHRAGLKEGSLLPADEVTNRVALGASTPFVPWAKALSDARTAAIESWKREHDSEDPAFLVEEKAAAQTTTGAKPEKGRDS